MTITPETILAGMQPFQPFGKASQTAVGAGSFHSLWKAGGLPTAGANPPAFNTSGYVPTKATAGAFPFNNPASGNSYLGHMWTYGTTSGGLILYDRVWACSGFGTVSTSLQTVTNQSDAGRYATFEGIELWLEVYTQTGATAATWTIVYTNQAGTANRTATYSHPATAEIVGKLIPVALQAGDTGVRSVRSFQCSATSGTAGDVGITLAHKLAIMPIRPESATQDAFQLGMERALDDACIAMMVACSTNSTGFVGGSFKLTQVEP